MRKRNKSWTIGEAVAYDEGYTDGYAAGIAAVHIGNKVRRHDYVECRSTNANLMCKECICWKIFREYCS